MKAVPFIGIRTERGLFIDGLTAHVRDTFGIGEEFAVVVRPHKDVRSLKANAYLWGVVYALMEEHTGEKADDIHDVMCERFLPNEKKRIAFFNQMTGQKLAYEIDQKRTSKLTGAPFYDFVEEVRGFARDFLQVETPDPDPLYWRKRDEKRRGKAA